MSRWRSRCFSNSWHLENSTDTSIFVFPRSHRIRFSLSKSKKMSLAKKLEISTAVSASTDVESAPCLSLLLSYRDGQIKMLSLSLPSFPPKSMEFSPGARWTENSLRRSLFLCLERNFVLISRSHSTINAWTAGEIMLLLAFITDVDLGQVAFRRYRSHGKSWFSTLMLYIRRHLRHLSVSRIDTWVNQPSLRR